jgi:hypothetical protein|nr:MAG TPA: hypothetical protein [Caudoviricetes sp.]
MSSVFIPLGGAGGKNRGEGVQVDENYTYLKLGDSGVGMPLPAGNYKAMKAEHGEENPFASYGDGKNAIVFMTKDFLKKVTIDLFGIASISNFSLTMYAHRQVRLTWAKPDRGLWSGVHFVFKYGSMPTNENDGFMVYDSADVHYETAKLEERELFVRAYSYVTVKDGRWYDEGKVSAKITVTGISGSVTLSTGAGVWTVPDKVSKIRYIIVGQGGEGEDNGANSYGAGGGGGGGYFETGYLNVTPGQNLSYVVPAPLNRANSQTWSKYYRGEYIPECDTIFAGIRAQHGRMAIRRYPGFDNSCLFIGGDGGSGGGGGNGGIGGRNGADGTSGGVNNISRRTTSTGVAGKGSHKSTTGFNGVLYSTGGNGASPYTGLSGQPGTNGLGNGGSGGGGSSVYCSGGTGGTGCIYIAWGSAMNDGT